MTPDVLHLCAPALPPVSRETIRLYMGQRTPDGETDALMEECLAMMRPTLAGRVLWARFSLRETADGLDLGFTTTRSADLRRHLAGCRETVLFAATLGMGPDRLILREGRLSPARALCCQAIGAERIEALCESFCGALSQKLGPTRPRYSPGYGDWPLAVQTDVFRALDCPRRLGLTLTESLLMSPTKSVTAIVGLENQENDT